MCTNLCRTLLLFSSLFVMILAGSVAAQEPPQTDTEPGAQKAQQIRRATAEQARQRTRAAAAQPGTRDAAQRLTQLEQKLDTLLREVRQLRQEIQRITPNKFPPVRDREAALNLNRFGPPRVGPHDMQRGPDPRGMRRDPRDMQRGPAPRGPDPRRVEGRRPDAQSRGPQRDAPRDMQRGPERREATPRRAEERRGDQPVRGDRPDRPQPESKKEATPRDKPVNKVESQRGASKEDGKEIDPKYVKYAESHIKKYDLNEDGVLTENEWRKMPQDYSSADTDKNGRISPMELGRFHQRSTQRDATPRREDERRGARPARGDRPERPQPERKKEAAQRDNAEKKVESKEDASKEVDAKYVKYAVGLIKKYDANKDGVLTENEWSKLPLDPSASDANKDGRISPVELGRFYQQGK